MKGLALLFGLGLSLDAFAASMRWGDIRDAVCTCKRIAPTR